MDFEERIKRGLQGEYKGLKNGFNRLNKYIFGVQRGCYSLIGGLSGSAKTTLADYILFNALEDAEAQEITLNVFYYSFEVDELTKKANWLSILIYNKYGRVIIPEKIKGLGDYRLDADELEIVNSERGEIDRLFSKIHWIWASTNPTGIYKELWNFMSNRGTFEEEDYIDEHNVPNKRITKFISNNPTEYNLVFLDHYALMRLQRREGKLLTLKENIDLMSDYFITLRNTFGLSVFTLQQFNQSINNFERQKYKDVDISPQQSDFKDSSNPYQDCDIAIGLMNAHKMDMKTCLDYSINQDFNTYNLRDRFRMLKVMKNKLSRDNICIGLFFKPEAGSFEELKPANELTSKDIEQLNKMINGQL